MPTLPNILQHGLSTALATSGDAVATIIERKRDFSDSIDPAKLFIVSQRYWMQVAVCICSAISLTSSLLAIYWFAKMKRKFRHKLIMLLISADTLRSTWLFAFTIVNLVRGVTQTKDPLCEVSGYFLQVAYGMADFSALAIAVHTALQIFRPVVFGVNGEEAGLYRYRVPIYISTAVLPLTICALAFTRNGPAFIAQGPLCSLPLRPFWYRLALSWIPRYLAMLTILILYIALYIHVGRQFGTFKISETFGFRPNGHNRKATLFSERNVFEMAPVQSSDIKIVHNRSGSIAHSLGAMRNALKVSARSSIRRASEGTTCVNGSTSTNSGNSGVTKRTESLDIPRPILLTPVSPRDACSFNKPEGHIAISPISRQDHAPNAILTGHVLGPSPTTRLADWNTEHGLQDLSEPILTREMRAKRNQAMRQLRLLFIYPICYFICWLVPFILNLTNYSNYLVQHPPFVIALLAYISIALMGTVSALVFSVRERPWRHTIGSDGTFFGSFVVWKHDATRRCSDNSFVGYGSTSASCSVPGSSAGHTLFSSQNVPTLSSPSRPAPSRGVSLFSLRSPNYQANALQRNEDRLATDRPPLITQVSANTTPRVHEKYWFDVPSGRSSDDEEAGRSF